METEEIDSFSLAAGTFQTVVANKSARVPAFRIESAAASARNGTGRIKCQVSGAHFGAFEP